MEEQRDKLGRFAKGRISTKRKNYVGMQFGYLTVESTEVRVEKSGKHRTYATCRCVCGKVVTREVSSLQRAERPNCGCMKKKIIQDVCRKDLTGKRFGRLVVEEMIWDSHPTRCKCRCDCGNECVIINTQLTSGKTKSCGCLQKEVTSELNTKDFTGMISDTGIKFIRRHKQTDKGVWEWECQCPCGNIFYAIPAKVANGHPTSCGCRTHVSSGEYMVEDVLSQHHIPYSTQYSFEDCKNVLPLRFDFAVEDNNNNVLFMIEYDGRQHFEPIDWFGGQEGFEQSKKRDQIKNEYCKSNNIPLLRLPYTLTKDEIEEKILNQCKCCESVETAGRSQ